MSNPLIKFRPPWKFLPTLLNVYTNCHFKKHKSTIGPPCRRQAVHPSSQTPRDISVAKPGTLLLILLSLVCKTDRKDVHGKLSTPLFEKNVRGQKQSNIKQLGARRRKLTILTLMVILKHPVFYKAQILWGEVCIRLLVVDTITWSSHEHVKFARA